MERQTTTYKAACIQIAKPQLRQLVCSIKKFLKFRNKATTIIDGPRSAKRKPSVEKLNRVDCVKKFA